MTENKKLRSLLAEAREVVRAVRNAGSLPYAQWTRDQHEADSIVGRIDAALAEPGEVHPSNLTTIIDVLETERDEARAELARWRELLANKREEYTQDDVNQMTSEMIALRKDYEKAAYQRGAEAMREAAATASQLVAMKCRSALAHPHESMTAHGADECARVIRGMLVPEDK